AAAWPAPRMTIPPDILQGMPDPRIAVKPDRRRDTTGVPPLIFPTASPRQTDGQESCEEACQTSALSPQGYFRRANERAAAGAARRDLFGAARHPQAVDRAVPDLAERTGARPSGAGARRPCAVQDLAVAAAVGDRDPRHRANLEGALRVVCACAPGREGRR